MTPSLHQVGATAARSQVEFIHINPGDSSGARNARRRIRIQVMKDYRRKERERQANTTRDCQTPRIEEETPPPHPPPHIPSPALTQVALTQKLREGWYPVGLGFSTLTTPSVRGFSPRSSAPVMAILDTMKLVHLGSIVKDERLLIEGRKRFLIATNFLRCNLELKEPSMPNVGLMLVSVGISMSEMYTAISQGSDEVTWQRQLVGMSALVLSRLPINMNSKLELYMIARFRSAQVNDIANYGINTTTMLTISQLVHSLCNRKQFPAECAAPAVRTSSPALDFLFDLAFRLPPLLESVDAAKLIKKAESGLFDNLKRDLASLERALTTWLGSFCKSFAQIEQDDNGTRQPQDAGPSSTYSITKREKGPSLFELSCESLCRICLLLLYQSRAALEPSSYSPTSAQGWSDSAAAVCADSLCHTVDLLAGVAQTPVARGMALRAPLHFLDQWFSYAGDCHGLRWCAEMTRDVRMNAPYLHWDSLMPWSLMPLIKVPG
ncbi:hypothetical protein Q7P37_008408 [Cladosporium fusiforme]